jgi:hypothetical protein
MKDHRLLKAIRIDEFHYAKNVTRNRPATAKARRQRKTAPAGAVMTFFRRPSGVARLRSWRSAR